MACKLQCDYLDYEMEHTVIKHEQITLMWEVRNFRSLMNRRYEFSSPVFSRNLSSGQSKWKIVVFPENIYPEGCHVAVRLVKMSEDDKVYSVIYSISLVDMNGEKRKLQTREKVFRKYQDFDECMVASNMRIKENCLLQNETLTIICELDLLVGVTEDSTYYESVKDEDNASFKMSELDKVNNIPMENEVINNLSYLKTEKVSSDKESNINALTKLDDELLKTYPEVNRTPIQDYASSESFLETLSDDLKSLYRNSHKCDVIIYVDDGKLAAHEVILSSRSDYFKQIFSSPSITEIHIPGINVTSLDAVLSYLYTGKVQPLSENTAMDLLKACSLLNLPHLMNVALNFLMSQISISNVLDIFKLSKEIKLDSLKTKALKFVAENHDEVSLTPQWNQMMRNHPHSAGEVLLTVASFQNKLAVDTL